MVLSKYIFRMRANPGFIKSDHTYTSGQIAELYGFDVKRFRVYISGLKKIPVTYAQKLENGAIEYIYKGEDILNFIQEG